MFNEDFWEVVIDIGAQQKFQYMQRGVGYLQVRVVALERRCVWKKSKFVGLHNLPPSFVGLLCAAVARRTKLSLSAQSLAASEEGQ